ncbi:MAG: nitrate reductase cytochrome c-type subunit [Hyphomicrobiaceae bacterium]|nr:MAG: nitrate reductase cytochrome c-type subunit [Hyphomicrobiaceae bacterium]
MKGYGKAGIQAVSLSLLAGLLVIGAGLAQELKSLGGEKTLEQTNSPPDVDKQSVPPNGFDRSYRQQPPLIPHKVDTYQITTGNNACMGCHDWPYHIEAKAPKASETHYVDREGVRLDKIAGTRYFCLQCHVPQADAKPLVKNTFLNATQAK